jgi:acetate kinase
VKPSSVLTINGGSSSIRFAIYEADRTPRLRLSGKIDRIGSSGATFEVNHVPVPFQKIKDHGAAVNHLLDWLEAQPIFSSIEAVGHRVVHGMNHSEPELITPKLLRELHRITRYDPDHLPREIGLIQAMREGHPKMPQVACFDTAFHRAMPRVAKLLPIPRRFEAKGVERYGFHGLSYAYLMEELARLDPDAAKGRVILAHLGSGASLAAVRNGKSIDTSMGFSPASGLVMGTRTGDLDPGLVYYLANTQGVTISKFQQMVNHKSGLLGVSGISSDVRDLLARESTDVRAAEAVELFCYQVTKWIGSFAAALGGLDTLVFAAGIGENSPVIRKRICEGLGFLGIELDEKRNKKNAALISRSPARGRVKVRVIQTNEELMTARSVVRLLKLA